ncbi:MFS transporter [Pseudoroseicyclus tamaricis]|uniref:MFS transporter n=1 Tax=Pseudoroseicyclus tamaricis TaxID=2705421 RepID=A0A6B2JMQ6_9RHOB|nr:MFS transporter [Pseudoroseicyclus tamaricis]NDU99936.1 MFS transporter [Pseudoroseicyclus tamaricis]
MLSLLRDRRAVALLMAATLTILSNQIISPSLPGIGEHFAASPNAELLSRLLVTAPSLLVAVFAPFAGMMADRFGRKRQLLIGIALFAIAGSGGLWLPTLPLILASRLVLGLGVALIMTAQTALIGDYFHGEQRGRFMGVQIAATNFSGFIFLLIAGVLAGMSPFAPFVIYLIGLAYLPFLWLSLTEPPRGEAQERAHPEEAGERGWVLLLCVVILLAGLNFVAFYMLPTQMPFYLTTLGHDEPAAAAKLVAGVTLFGGLSSLAYGRVRARLGRALTPTLGFALFAAGFAIFGIAPSYGVVLAGGVLLGLAAGLVWPTFLSIALDVVPAHRRGLASGAVTTSVFLGQFVSPLVSQPLIDTFGFAGTFEAMAVLLAAMAVLVLLTFRERGPALAAA